MKAKYWALQSALGLSWVPLYGTQMTGLDNVLLFMSPQQATEWRRERAGLYGPLKLVEIHMEVVDDSRNSVRPGRKRRSNRKAKRRRLHV